MRIYGLAEIAQECGVSVLTARKWQERGKLPNPQRIKAGYVWTGRPIEKFIADHRKEHQ